MSQNGEQAPEQPQSPSDVFKQRTTKLAALKEAGINAYGGRVDDVVSTTEARSAFEKAAEDEEVRVVLAGRLMAKRIMGKSIFADIKDENGRLQLYVQKKVLEDQFQIFKSLDLGDILTATGTIFVTRMGEVSLRVEQFRILSKSLRALPEKWHGLTNVEQRYRQRYLDLIVNDDVRETFRTRSRIVASIRSYMADQGFMEVETPMMQPLAGGAAARPFKTHYNALGCPMYMRIAPELYLKRLLVGGFEKVFELNRNFRNEGLSRRHNPEFTMIEAYQAYSDCQGMMELVEGMITTAARDVLGTLILEKEGRETLDLTPPWRRVTYAELIRETMGEDWYDLPTDKKREKARARDLTIPDNDPDHEITHEVYEKIVEHTLIQPTFVTRLPAFLVPLAKRCEDDPTVVDVYELEINGQEISPGYSELNDPIEQRSRFDTQAIGSTADDQGEVDRIDEDFLNAMEHGMPPAGGLGLGIDRLVMLLTGAESIRDVIFFPQMRLQQPRHTETETDGE